MRALKEELRRLLHQTGFSASLDSFDLLDVIQIITMSRKSIALVVSIGVEEEGILRFQNGELIWAEYGILRGEEAFFALAAHKNGTVVHRPWNEQITPNVTQPLSRLIFKALQYRSKYADYQQLSNEMESIKPANVPPSSPGLPQLTPQTPPQFPGAFSDMEEDDRPFQFVTEDASLVRETLHTGSGLSFDQLMRDTSLTGSSLDQQGTPSGMLRTVGPEAGSPVSGEPKKEWWEATGSFPRSQKSSQVRATTDETMGKPSFASHVPATPSTTQNNGLPSWLTDQPTNLQLPVMRGNTGQMPAAPREPQPQSPGFPHVPRQATGQMPAVPRDQTLARGNTGQMPVPSATWSPSTNGNGARPPVQPLSPSQPSMPGLPASAGIAGNVNGLSAQPPAGIPGGLPLPSESGLRKIKPDEALFTGAQRAIRPAFNPPGPPTGGQMSPLKGNGIENAGEPLQSLAALEKISQLPPVEHAPRPGLKGSAISSPEQRASSSGPALPDNPALFNGQSGRVEARPASGTPGAVPFPEIRAAGSSTGTGAGPGKQTREPVTPREAPGSSVASGKSSLKRNYPALAAALQTLGYSVPGFVASAVVSLDGTPIAQVAVDELDISQACNQFSQVMQGALKAMEVGHERECDYVLITSRTQHILLRLVGESQDVFQILITTRDANPMESLDVMTNVEAAISASLNSMLNR
jgi:predicted regulator of Ras-like GTPase activity (Roadblock/LC7/MglB family)